MVKTIIKGLGGEEKINTPKTIATHQYYNTENLNLRRNDYNDFFRENFIVDQKSQSYLLIVQKLQELFISLFDYQIDNDLYSEKEKRDFAVKLERTLFQNGRCAIVKFGKKIYPLPFTYQDSDLDIYDNPTRIKVLFKGNTANNKKDALNGFKELVFENSIDKTEFVIVNNNSHHLRTLFNLYERIIELCKRIKELDNASYISRPRIFWVNDADDASVRDINLGLENDNNTITKVPDDFHDNIIMFQGTDVTPSRMELVLFYTNFLLKMLGFSVNDLNNKAERQTELEIKKSDTFTGVLKDMFKEREVATKDTTKLLETKISVKIDENFMLTELDKNKTYSETGANNDQIIKEYGGK